jgi:hypothetical protein
LAHRRAAATPAHESTRVPLRGRRAAATRAHESTRVPLHPSTTGRLKARSRSMSPLHPDLGSPLPTSSVYLYIYTHIHIYIYIYIYKYRYTDMDAIFPTTSAPRATETGHVRAGTARYDSRQPRLHRDGERATKLVSSAPLLAVPRKRRAYTCQRSSSERHRASSTDLQQPCSRT